MRSGPDGGLNRRKHSRLNLKSAVALATLSLAGVAPAEAQNTEQPTIETQPAQDVQNDEQFPRIILEAKSSIEKTKAFLREVRAFSRDQSFIQRTERRIQDTEAFLTDPQYLRGLQKIEQYGGKVGHFAGNADPAILMDSQKLDSLFSRIPAELRTHAQLNTDDLKDDPGYSYTRSGLAETARQLSENGIQLGVGEIHEILNFGEKNPPFITSFVSFIKSTNDRVHPRNLMGNIRRGTITTEDLANEKFTGGLLKLIAGGIELYNIVPDKLDEAAHNDLVQRVSDPDSVEKYLGLKTIGYKLSSRAFQNLSFDTINSPNFLKNAQLLRLAGAVDYSPEDLDVALKLDGLEGVLNQTLPGKLYGIDGAMNFIKAVGADADSWKAALEQYALHATDEVALSTVRTLGKSYLKNPSFVSILNGVLKNKRVSDPYTNRYEAIKEFLIKETGKDRISLWRSLQDYLSIAQNPRTNPLVLEIIKDDEGMAFRAPVFQMNELHDGAVAERLQQLRDIKAQDVFKVMMTAGADAYLSTFRLMYNGNGFTGQEAQNSLLARVKGEYGTLSVFFQALRPDYKAFGTFLELLSQNNILDTFLSDIGSSDDQHAILREFLFNASTGISSPQALTLSDLLRTTKTESIREFVFGELRGVQEGATSKSSKIAGLLIADYFQGKADVPEWARASVQEYEKYFPEIKELSEDKMFRKEGELKRNVQVHFFYNDSAPGKPEAAWDGHHSFKNFITSLGGSVSWNKDGAIQRVTVNRGYEVKDEGDYVVIRQADNRTKREVVMYAIKPDRTDETVAKVGGQLLKEKNAPIATLRGHSFHAWKMIKELIPTVVMVNLGSCGGAKNISDVLAKSPSAQVMATRGVGTMLVNDVVIPSLNSALLRDGGIQWAQFGTQMTAEFKKRGGLAQERWGSYQMPDKNRIAHLIAALKALEK